VFASSYLIRAYHEWMEDSGLTPHILVDCSKADVVVPKPFIQQDKIVLNISNNATTSLVINNDGAQSNNTQQPRQC
jgi:stringent starvation protein B